MAERNPVSFKTDPETIAEVDDYEARRDLDSRSEALERLVKVVLREQKTPLLYQWQKNAVQASHYLMIAAIVVAVIGITPAGFNWTTGAWAGGALVMVGLAIIAVVEAARTVRGTNELGEAIRGGNA